MMWHRPPRSRLRRQLRPPPSRPTLWCSARSTWRTGRRVPLTRRRRRHPSPDPRSSCPSPRLAAAPCSPPLVARLSRRCQRVSSHRPRHHPQACVQTAEMRFTQRPRASRVRLASTDSSRATPWAGRRPTCRSPRPDQASAAHARHAAWSSPDTCSCSTTSPFAPTTAASRPAVPSSTAIRTVVVAAARSTTKGA